MCGVCKYGYSASILSNECLSDSECGTSWLWAASVIAVISYMLWYTFKDDILGFPSVLATKLFCRKESNKGSDSEDIDKGYFCITTYFVQASAMMRLSIMLDGIDSLTNIIQEVEKHTGLLLSIELSYVSFDICPYQGANTYDKLSFKLMFLMSIYLSWFITFILLLSVFKTINKILKEKYLNFWIVLKLRFIKGIIEIIKYTYGGFTDIIFTSVTCVSIANDNVWKYDGTVSCFSSWQIGMIVICVIYVLPFPAKLLLGLKLLKFKRISSSRFLLGCIVPLPFLFT